MDIVEKIKEFLPEYKEVTERQIFENKYVPLEWANKFHASPYMNSYLCGAVGSGKSHAAAEEFKQLLFEYPGATGLVGRMFLPDLKKTAMKTLLDKIPTKLIYNFNKTDRIITLVNGSQIWFLGLVDDFENPEKLKSYEYMLSWVEEASELPRPIHDKVLERRRQKFLTKPYRQKSIFTFNPVGEEHWLYDVCVRNLRSTIDIEVAGKKKTVKFSDVHHSRTADNLKNLPPTYVEEIKATYPPEVWFQILEGKFGNIPTKDAVFSGIFNRAIHCREMKPRVGTKLRRAWDWGFNHPTCIVFGLTDFGQYKFYKEYIGNKEHLEVFAQRTLQHMKEEFPGCFYIKDYGDPKGADKKSTGKSDIEVMKDEFGIVINFKTGQHIMDGITVMRRLMNRNHNGEPLFLVDPIGCPTLVSALSSGYKMHPTDNIPIKDDYYDHIVDCARYGIINTNAYDLAMVQSLKKSYTNPYASMYSSRKGR